jgi:hypothetical protein
MKVKVFTTAFIIIFLTTVTVQGAEPKCTPYTHFVAPGFDYKGIIKFDGMDLDLKKDGLQRTLVVAPGEKMAAQAGWTFGTACPGCRFYVNVFGSWNPETEIAKLYSGPIGSVSSSEVSPFFFRAPKVPGEYVVRAVFILGDGYADDFHASNLKFSCSGDQHIFVMDSFLNVSGEYLGVEILSPPSGRGVVEESLGDTVVINASIHGNATEVVVFIDGKNVSNKLPYTWNTANESQGLHVVAVEAAGNNTRAREEVTVELSNLSKVGKPPSVTWVKEFNNGFVEAQLSGDARLVLILADDTLYLYRQKGDPVWRKSLRGITQVAISREGSALAAASEKLFLYLSASGEVLWNRTFPEKISSIALTPSGKAAVAFGKEIYYLDALGRRLWNISLEETIDTITAPGEESIAVSAKNRIYLLSNGSSIRWSYLAPGDVKAIASTPAGTVAAATEKDLLYLSEGTLKQSFPANGSIVSVALSSGGRNIITAAGRVLRLYQNGTLLWSKETRSPVKNVFLSEDASILVYSEDGRIVLSRIEPEKRGGVYITGMKTYGVVAALVAIAAVGLILYSRRKKPKKEVPPPTGKKEIQVELEPVSEDLKILGEGSLMVHVLNSKTKKPVIRARIRLDGRFKETDEKGQALFEDVGKGRYSLRVERESYKPIKAEHVFRGPEEQIRLELTPVIGLREEDETRLKAALEEVKRSYSAVSHLDSCLPGYFKSIAENIVDFVETSSDLPGDFKFDYSYLIEGLVSISEEVCKDLSEIILDWRNVKLYEVGGGPGEDCPAKAFGDIGKMEKAASDPGRFLDIHMRAISRRLTLLDSEITDKIGELTIIPLSGIWRIAQKLVEHARQSTGQGGKEELRASIGLIFADSLLEYVEEMLQKENVLGRMRHQIL